MAHEGSSPKPSEATQKGIATTAVGTLPRMTPINPVMVPVNGRPIRRTALWVDAALCAIKSCEMRSSWEGSSVGA
jgi:hypothetical protein